MGKQTPSNKGCAAHYCSKFKANSPTSMCKSKYKIYTVHTYKL